MNYEELIKDAPRWPYPVNYGKENEVNCDILVLGGGIAGCWAASLAEHGLPATVQAGESTVGGGALPGSALPTWHMAIAVPSPDEMSRGLRLGRPAVIAIIKEDRLLLDPRTVQPDEDEDLLAAVERAYRGQTSEV